MKEAQNRLDMLSCTQKGGSKINLTKFIVLKGPRTRIIGF